MLWSVSLSACVCLLISFSLLELDVILTVSCHNFNIFHASSYPFPQFVTPYQCYPPHLMINGFEVLIPVYWCICPFVLAVYVDDKVFSAWLTLQSVYVAVCIASLMQWDVAPVAKSFIMQTACRRLLFYYVAPFEMKHLGFSWITTLAWIKAEGQKPHRGFNKWGPSRG